MRGGGGHRRRTFLRRFEGRDGDDDSVTASLRSSRRGRWARFPGEGMVGNRGPALDHEARNRDKKGWAG
jgi:hypothetical protein